MNCKLFWNLLIIMVNLYLFFFFTLVSTAEGSTDVSHFTPQPPSFIVNKKYWQEKTIHNLSYVTMMGASNHPTFGLRPTVCQLNYSRFACADWRLLSPSSFFLRTSLMKEDPMAQNSLFCSIRETRLSGLAVVPYNVLTLILLLSQPSHSNIEWKASSTAWSQYQQTGESSFPNLWS